MTTPKAQPPQEQEQDTVDQETAERSARASAVSHVVLHEALQAFAVDDDMRPLDLIMGIAFALASACAAHGTPVPLLRRILDGVVESAQRLQDAGDPPTVPLRCSRCGLSSATASGLRGVSGPLHGDFALCSRCGSWHRWTSDGAWQAVEVEAIEDRDTQLLLQRIASTIVAAFDKSRAITH